MEQNLIKTRLITTSKTALELTIKKSTWWIVPTFYEQFQNSKGTSQEIHPRQAFGRAVVKDLEKIFKCWAVSMKILVFPVTPYGNEKWTSKKEERKSICIFVL